MSSPPPGNSTSPTSPSATPPSNNTTSPPTATPTTPAASPPPTATPTTPAASPPPTATPTTPAASPPPTATPTTPAASPPPSATPTTPAASSPPPTTPATSPPPPTVPVTSPPPPTTPITPAASPPPPTTPATSPPPPKTTPATSPPPPTTPITPTTSPPPPTTPARSPPAATTPIAPVASPPPPTTPGTNDSPPPAPALASPPPPSRSLTPSPPANLSPPAVTGISPPTTGNQTPPPSGSSSNSTGLIAGLAIGGVFALVLLGVLFICCKKRRRDQGPAHYYGPTPPGRKDDPYAGPPQHWQLNAPPPSDHLITVMPKPSPPSGVASRPTHSPAQIPNHTPPLFSNSSGGSNYSGSENPLLQPSAGIALGFSKSTFTYEELAMATDGFSDANLLGQGGFGFVHRGILPNGKEVAIKQLKAGSGQGEREFQAEIETISRVHHKHLVTLVGYCITGAQRLLVYEFVQNGTLEFHLHGKGRPIMDWATRLKIALGSAKGLAYLHEDCHPKIIHRDIKAANILLDFKFEAKVADFGLAKFSSDTNSHVSTRVMGTFGYLAPEYASSGKLTEKSDVFSFGVMLLELITGRPPFNITQAYMDDSLVEWARPLLTRSLEDGNFDTLVDPRLQKDYNPNEMACMVACAAACVRHAARRRPRMSQTVRALEGDASLDDLNEGIRPGHSTVYSAYGSSDYDTSQYNEDMKKFRKAVLASQEYSSSEYSRPTSEYGLYPSGSSSEGQQTTREMKIRK